MIRGLRSIFNEPLRPFAAFGLGLTSGTAAAADFSSGLCMAASFGVAGALYNKGRQKYAHRENWTEMDYNAQKNRFFDTQQFYSLSIGAALCSLATNMSPTIVAPLLASIVYFSCRHHDNVELQLEDLRLQENRRMFREFALERRLKALGETREAVRGLQPAGSGP